MENINPVDFWDNHSIVFVVAMCFFPRLTMLFATSSGGGIFYWVGWLFAPRLTVAIIATICYGETNMVLVAITWIWALGGESAEKTAGSRQVSRFESVSRSESVCQ